MPAAIERPAAKSRIGIILAEQRLKRQLFALLRDAVNSPQADQTLGVQQAAAWRRVMSKAPA